MGLLTWFRRQGLPDSRHAREWRTACAGAAMEPDEERLRALERDLVSWGADEEDIEIEREMVEGLEDVVRLSAAVRESGVPVIATGHRAIGADTCHFTAPASMPDEDGQPSGRLLLTDRRLVFVGGARGEAIPWHAINRVMLTERDVVLVRGGDQVHRFRCNSFSEAFRAAFLARELVAARRASQGL